MDPLARKAGQKSNGHSEPQSDLPRSDSTSGARQRENRYKDFWISKTLNALSHTVSSLSQQRSPRVEIDDKFVTQIRARVLELSSRPEIAEELSLLLAIIQKVKANHYDIDQIEQRCNFILDILANDNSNIILARDERLRIQIEIYGQSGFISSILAQISTGSPVSLVLVALFMSLFIWTGVVFAIDELLSLDNVGMSSRLKSIFFMDSSPFLIIASAALIGGIVSIATRLDQFSRMRDLDPFAVFWTAMLKPLIGVVLSIFILAAWAGNVINFPFIDTPSIGNNDVLQISTSQNYILWVIGFISGFSERFAWDFVGRVEGTSDTAPVANRP